MTAWNVYVPKECDVDELIDTVFYSGNVDADEVRKSLIEHDGYPSNIIVEEDHA